MRLRCAAQVQPFPPSPRHASIPFSSARASDALYSLIYSKKTAAGETLERTFQDMPGASRTTMMCCGLCPSLVTDHKSTVRLDYRYTRDLLSGLIKNGSKSWRRRQECPRRHQAVKTERRHCYTLFCELSK